MYVSMYNSPFPKLNPKVRYKTALERAGFDVKKSSHQDSSDPLRSAKSTPLLKSTFTETSREKLPPISNRSVPNITLETRSAISNSSLMAEDKFNDDTGDTSHLQSVSESLYNDYNNNNNKNLLKMQSYQQSEVVSIDLNSDLVESVSAQSITNITDDKDVSTSTKLFSNNESSSILQDNNLVSNLLLNNNVDLLPIPDDIITNGTSQSSISEPVPLSNIETIPLLHREITPLQTSERSSLSSIETIPLSNNEAVPLPNNEAVPLSNNETTSSPDNEVIPLPDNETLPLPDNETTSSTNIESSSLTNSGFISLSNMETISLTDNKTTQLSDKETLPLSDDASIPFSISEATSLSNNESIPIEEKGDQNSHLTHSHDSKLRELIDRLDETPLPKEQEEEANNTLHLNLPSNINKKSSFYLSGVSISSTDQQSLGEERTRYSTGEGPCRSCAGVVNDHARFANELSGQWHKECFRCIKCYNKFNKQNPCYILDDQPYCRQDYHIVNHTICQICDTYIEGECLENDKMERFHVHCLTCLLCKEVIRSNYFIFNGNIPICGRHDIDQLVKDGIIEFDTSSPSTPQHDSPKNTKNTKNTVEKRRTRLLNF